MMSYDDGGIREVRFDTLEAEALNELAAGPCHKRVVKLSEFICNRRVSHLQNCV